MCGSGTDGTSCQSPTDSKLRLIAVKLPPLLKFMWVEYRRLIHDCGKFISISHDVSAESVFRIPSKVERGYSIVLYTMDWSLHWLLG